MTVGEQRFMSIVESSLRGIMKALEEANELKKQEIELKRQELEIMKNQANRA